MRMRLVIAPIAAALLMAPEVTLSQVSDPEPMAAAMVGAVRHVHPIAPTWRGEASVAVTYRASGRTTFGEESEDKIREATQRAGQIAEEREWEFVDAPLVELMICREGEEGRECTVAPHRVIAVPRAGSEDGSDRQSWLISTYQAAPRTVWGVSAQTHLVVIVREEGAWTVESVKTIEMS